MRNFGFSSLALAVLLVGKLSKAVVDVDFTVDYVYNTRRYDMAADISKDNRLTVTLSTDTTKIDSLAAIGPGREVNLSWRDSYGMVLFHNKGNVSEVQLGEWHVKGTVNLDSGLTAKVTGNVWWEFDMAYGKSEDIKKKVIIAEIVGPANATYTSKFNSSRPAYIKAGYCSGWDQSGRSTWDITYLNFDLDIQIVRNDTATPEARGSVGEKSPVALEFTTDLLIKEGCSRDASLKFCEKDRTGYELCSNDCLCGFQPPSLPAT